MELALKMRVKMADIGTLVKDNLFDRQKKIKALVFDCHMKAQSHGANDVIRNVNFFNYQVSVPSWRGTVTYNVNLLRKYMRAVLQPTQADENDGVDIDYLRIAGEGDPDDIINMCNKCMDVLTTRPGQTNILTHYIKTTSRHQLNNGNIEYSSQHKELKAIFDEMLKQGIIQPPNSAWSSPCVFVDKKDGTLRLCVDCRKLNNITLFDAYPVPRMDGLFEKIGNGS
ncbi:hypothetical protein ACJMK2_036022 [Sinanodonta woodiana]|uniref:Uncharacterized protein n=1 Tax=Sinanodonta woodiana TaxID=1069815 RepID=A0ABD3WFV7_SINWO